MEKNSIRLLAGALLALTGLLASANLAIAQERYFEHVASLGQQPAAVASPGTGPTGQMDLDERLEQVRSRLDAIEDLVSPESELIGREKARQAFLLSRQKQQARALRSAEKAVAQSLADLQKQQKEFVNGCGGIQNVLSDAQLAACLLEMQTRYEQQQGQLDQARRIVLANNTTLAQEQARSSVNILMAKTRSCLDASGTGVPHFEPIAGSQTDTANQPAPPQTFTPEMKERTAQVLRTLFPNEPALRGTVAAAPANPDTGSRGSRVARVRTGTAFGSKIIDVGHE